MEWDARVFPWSIPFRFTQTFAARRDDGNRAGWTVTRPVWTRKRLTSATMTPPPQVGSAAAAADHAHPVSEFRLTAMKATMSLVNEVQLSACITTRRFLAQNLGSTLGGAMGWWQYIVTCGVPLAQRIYSTRSRTCTLHGGKGFCFFHTDDSSHVNPACANAFLFFPRRPNDVSAGPDQRAAAVHEAGALARPAAALPHRLQLAGRSAARGTRLHLHHGQWARRAVTRFVIWNEKTLHHASWQENTCARICTQKDFAVDFVFFFLVLSFAFALCTTPVFFKIGTFLVWN